MLYADFGPTFRGNGSDLMPGFRIDRYERRTSPGGDLADKRAFLLDILRHVCNTLLQRDIEKGKLSLHRRRRAI